MAADSSAPDDGLAEMRAQIASLQYSLLTEKSTNRELAKRLAAARTASGTPLPPARARALIAAEAESLIWRRVASTVAAGASLKEALRAEADAAELASTRGSVDREWLTPRAMWDTVATLPLDVNPPSFIKASRAEPSPGEHAGEPSVPPAELTAPPSPTPPPLCALKEQQPPLLEAFFVAGPSAFSVLAALKYRPNMDFATFVAAPPPPPPMMLAFNHQRGSSLEVTLPGDPTLLAELAMPTGATVRAISNDAISRAEQVPLFDHGGARRGRSSHVYFIDEGAKIAVCLTIVEAVTLETLRAAAGLPRKAACGGTVLVPRTLVAVSSYPAVETLFQFLCSVASQWKKIVLERAAVFVAEGIPLRSSLIPLFPSIPSPQSAHPSRGNADKTPPSRSPQRGGTPVRAGPASAAADHLRAVTGINDGNEVTRPASSPPLRPRSASTSPARVDQLVARSPISSHTGVTTVSPARSQVQSTTVSRTESRSASPAREVGNFYSFTDGLADFARRLGGVVGGSSSSAGGGGALRPLGEPLAAQSATIDNPNEKFLEASFSVEPGTDSERGSSGGGARARNVTSESIAWTSYDEADAAEADRQIDADCSALLAALKAAAYPPEIRVLVESFEAAASQASKMVRALDWSYGASGVGPRVRWTRAGLPPTPRFAPATRAAIGAWAIPLLCSLVPAESLMFLLGAALTEHRIIFVGGALGMDAASSAVLGLDALLAPLKWVSTLIPSLPLNKSEYLSPAGPIIVGTPSLPSDWVQDSETLVVLLDRETLRIPTEQQEVATSQSSSSPPATGMGLLKLLPPDSSALFNKLESHAAVLSGVDPSSGRGRRPCFAPSPSQAAAAKAITTIVNRYVTDLVSVVYAMGGQMTDFKKVSERVLEFVHRKAEAEVPFWKRFLESMMINHAFNERAEARNAAAATAAAAAAAALTTRGASPPANREASHAAAREAYLVTTADKLFSAAHDASVLASALLGGSMSPPPVPNAQSTRALEARRLGSSWQQRPAAPIRIGPPAAVVAVRSRSSRELTAQPHI